MVPSPARLDFSTATAAVAELDRALRGGAGSGSAVGVDLSTLTHFDSSALSVLLELRRRFAGSPAGATAAAPAAAAAAAAKAPGAFTVAHPPTPLRELAEVYGVAELLFGSPAAARQ